MDKLQSIKKLYCSILLLAIFASAFGEKKKTKESIFYTFENTATLIDTAKCNKIKNNIENWSIYMPKEWSGQFGDEAPSLKVYNKNLFIKCYTIWDVNDNIIAVKIKGNKKKYSKVIKIEESDILMINLKKKKQLEFYYQIIGTSYITLFIINNLHKDYSEKDLREIKYLIQQFLRIHPSKEIATNT